MSEPVAYTRRDAAPACEWIDVDHHNGVTGVLCLRCGRYRSIRGETWREVVEVHSHCKPPVIP